MTTSLTTTTSSTKRGGGAIASSRRRDSRRRRSAKSALFLSTAAPRFRTKGKTSGTTISVTTLRASSMNDTNNNNGGGGGEEKKDVNAIDWDAQNDRFKAERIFDQCLGAIADGDVDALESCLSQIESDKKVAKLSKKLEDATPDAFWKKKVKEIAATRIVDDCMSAILSGDASEIDGCILEVENEMEYLEKNV